jgi:hypothetical protein
MELLSHVDRVIAYAVSRWPHNHVSPEAGTVDPLVAGLTNELSLTLSHKRKK